MKYRQFLLFWVAFTFVNKTIAQPEWLTEKVFKSPGRKHQIWLHWGYNRGQFTTSDIQFTGPGYDFTLENVVAKDRQSPFDVNVYFNPQWWTVPQYNLRLGFFLTDRFSLSFGHDHMKYVMVQNQIAKMNGYIDPSASTIYAGNYDNQAVTLTNDFLEFEHTNGLNYVSFEGNFYGNIYINPSKKFQLDFYLGTGAGFLYPRSDVDLFNIEGVNVFHVAGWGVDIEAGLRMDFFKVFFLNLQAKAGFISMPNVLTVVSGHKAKQSFFFLQEIATLGFSINYFNKNRDSDGVLINEPR